MATARTSHYGLTRMASTQFAEDSWKYTDADRERIDQLLHLGAEGHHHTGASAATSPPGSGAGLSVATTGGSMPAGARVRYEYTLVGPDGIESGPSPEAFVDTTPAIATPAAPTGTVLASTTGTLAPGPYFYTVSAYKAANSLETKVGTALFVAVPLGTSTNKITFTLPTLPGGADGLNIYRQGPANVGARYLASVVAPSPGATYVDNGSQAEDPDRPPPTINTTKATNLITVTPVAVPAGFSWRIYRTFVADVWTNSLLTTQDSDTLSYDDVGAVTSVGQPPSSNLVPGSPSKVQLTNGAEVQGVLPASMVAGLYGSFPEMRTANQAAGVIVLDDTGRTEVRHLPGAVLVGLAATFR